jgi:CTP synthase (UTP-ammonia lyase)
MSGAAHAEYDPDAPDAADALIAPIACAVPGPGPTLFGEQEIALLPDSRAAAICGGTALAENFQCSYGVNPAFQSVIDAGGLRVTGVGAADEARVVELPGRRFYVATLFLPQHNSTAERPHPLIVAFMEAAARFRDERG